jgi:hypothetical protein
MAEGLKACDLETVVRPSTGVSWMAVYEVLQSHGFQVNRVEARGTQNLRKSEVPECQEWLRLHP